MQSYLYQQITENRKAPRLWIEGSRPAQAGFTPGQRYTITVDAAERRVTLAVAEDGQRKVSSKTRKNGTEYPVIDLNSREVLSIFDGVNCVRVIMSENAIHILPAVAELKRRARLNALAAKLESGDPISVGSIAHGGGVLSHALHTGMAEEGMESKLDFANEIREDLLEQAALVNSAWNKDTRYVAAPMQDLALDRWALDRLGHVDVLEAGIPCSGASVAGRSKLGTACAEAHPEVGHLVVPFIQLISALNPAAIVLENVKPYLNTASMWILRNSLRELGYDVHETVLDAAEWNALEHRQRMCMVAVTRGMHFSFDELERPVRIERKLGEVMESVPDDDPRWSEMGYLKAHAEKHAAKGNGFAMQLFDADSDHVSTITKGYMKRRATDPMVKNASKPELLRLLTPAEHARCKGVPDVLVEGLTGTTAHEMLGQSICYEPFRYLGRLLARSLKAKVDMAAAAPERDLLAAA